jgi:hypothetical protein
MRRDQAGGRRADRISARAIRERVLQAAEDRTEARARETGIREGRRRVRHAGVLAAGAEERREERRRQGEADRRRVHLRTAAEAEEAVRMVRREEAGGTRVRHPRRHRRLHTHRRRVREGRIESGGLVGDQ